MNLNNIKCLVYPGVVLKESYFTWLPKYVYLNLKMSSTKTAKQKFDVELFSLVDLQDL